MVATESMGAREKVWNGVRGEEKGWEWGFVCAAQGAGHVCDGVAEEGFGLGAGSAPAITGGTRRGPT
jgi:hypothetical protein